MQKKIALINDLSGFGRCSLSVWLPILSVLKHECLLMPTALLSNHTAYPEYWLRDLAQDLDPWMDQWKKLHVNPDVILSGYISNAQQGEKILRFQNLFADISPLIIVDPAMADDGALYPGLDENTVAAMRKLCSNAKLILPNLSEACLLADISFSDSLTEDPDALIALGKQLQNLGPDQVVITGIPLIRESKKMVGCLVIDQNQAPLWILSEKIAAPRPGTGDVFSAVTAGCIINDISLVESVQIAADFVCACLKKSEEEKTPPFEGVPFELLLGDLFTVTTEKEPDENLSR